MLKGVRVLDFTHMLAGPYATMLLGDLQAEVIKIEPLDVGDRTRLMGPHFLGGESAYFLSINRNKKSLTLDLKQPAGREIFHRLVKVSDVVIDNFRPGTMEQLAADHNTLCGINPRIITCSISGFGQTGPYRDRPAFDLALQAISGAMSITGEPGRPPVRMGVPMGDLAGSLFGAFAIVSALYERERTGLGRAIDLGLMDCMVALLTYVGQYYLISNEVPQPIGTSHQSVVPYQAFPTSDGYIVVAIFVEKFWNIFCGVLGAEHLIADPRFADNNRRSANRADLIPLVETILRTHPSAQWLTALNEGGVPCAPINTLDQVFAEPQVADREMVVHLDHPTAGRFSTLGTPIKTGSQEDQSWTPPPLHGEHTEEILRDLVKCTESEIADLRLARVI
ncbi:succinyl-CoA:mesaconate CoA transferase [Anaerolineae bacterium]|nr:succinyl-CoA:mesaconate CoA transferase [Anaerolineae bacterium]